ncbi:MAG: hypothetical protein NVS3B7_04050 [Candidatus Elarobacter sp.]
MSRTPRPLFGYGTFRKTAWRDAILGADYPFAPATLPGWRRIALPSGYFSLRETVVPLAAVPGVVIALDELGWQIADAWEEVPAYEHVEVAVNTMDGPVLAVTYVCSFEADATPVVGDRFALLSDEAVESSIAAFASTMRALRGGRGG